MLELRFIREHLDLVKAKTAKRGLNTDMIDRFAEVDRGRLAALAEGESLKNRRNTVSKEIALFKKSGDETAAQPLIEEMKTANTRIKELDRELLIIHNELEDIVMSIPNLCDDSVPEGQDETDNIEVKRWGDKPAFNFAPKPHWDLGVELGVPVFLCSVASAPGSSGP
jgi:seryl-tRNA synthetase